LLTPWDLFRPDFSLRLLAVILSGCTAPIGADLSSSARAYRQTHDNAVSHGQPSRDTRSVLQRFQSMEHFDRFPDESLQMIHRKAVESGDRSLLFALSELNYLVGERLRHSVKPWESRGPTGLLSRRLSLRVVVPLRRRGRSAARAL
jgi:hypothetical protein